MRLVRTQAKDTKKIIKKAEAVILEAIRTGNFFNLQIKLEAVLNALPGTALELVRSLAIYESKFSYKTLKKHNKDTKPITESVAITAAETVKVATTLHRPSQTIENTYTKFATSIVVRQIQLVRDAQVKELPKDEMVGLVTAQTAGLFSYQNLALAGLAVIGTANEVRAEVARANDYKIEWSAILDESTCGFCEDQDGQIFENSEENEIPAHANCRCTWIIVDAEEID